MEKEFEKVKTLYLGLQNKLPRGHKRLFLVLCLLYSSFLTLLALFYMNATKFFVETWGSPDNPYLQHYRPIARWAWLLIETVTPVIYFLIFPMVFLILLWYLQHRLPRWKARILIQAIVFFLFIVSTLQGCAFVSLMIMPL